MIQSIMKTFFLLILSLLLVASFPCIAATNYSISFTGTGASTTVGDVIVQNLTQGTSVTVTAGNVLNLSVESTAVEQQNANDENIRVYPGTLEGESILSFFSIKSGNAQINAYSLDGRKIAGITTILPDGENSFKLSLPSGSYAIQVTGNGYSYNVKMINQSTKHSNPEITYIGDATPFSSASQQSRSSALATNTMIYNVGDLLLYKGTSGIYSTIVVDSPTASKTTNFDFVACTDADGNNYSVVKIGTQTWLVENLKTTKYRNGDLLGTTTRNVSMETTPKYQWTYGDAATFGLLYTWDAIMDNRNICPVGWHIPTNDEWDLLAAETMYSASPLKETDNSHWVTNSGSNTTGFTARPNGYRNGGGFTYLLGAGAYWWSSTEAPTAGTAWTRLMNSTDNSFYKMANYKCAGLGVRCVKD